MPNVPPAFFIPVREAVLLGEMIGKRKKNYPSEWGAPDLTRWTGGGAAERIARACDPKHAPYVGANRLKVEEVEDSVAPDLIRGDGRF
jgi:hypothetical protein